MKSLAQEFQVLVDQGKITPSLYAPSLETSYQNGSAFMRTVYGIGEITNHSGSIDGKLVSGSSGDSDGRRQT